MVAADRSFIIDYENNQFLKDGEPYRYISGSIHYYRLPQQYWQDRLDKMKAGGLTTIQTYVDWSQHEPEPGTYNFEDNLDIVAFFSLVNETGLTGILRAGPFIDAERDFGGLPYWLFRENPDMVLRSSDPTFLNFVDIFYTELFSRIKPLLYANGGPIISVQVENEYGSYYTCDSVYLAHLRDLFRNLLGDDVVLFTTDGPGGQDCGKIPEVYSTVDFGPGSDVDSCFASQREYEPQGPLVNSEFYTGWLDHWGELHSQENPRQVQQTLDEILARDASVNMYMYFGGTSFGFTAGSNMGGTFQACPTSYDYDAPLSEAGDTSNAYFAIREVIANYSQDPFDPVPPNTTKYGYGIVQLKPVGSLFELLPELVVGPTVNSEAPLTFEALGQAYGFVLYETVIPEDHFDSVLRVTEIRDRGYVFVDQVSVGILSREESIITVDVSIKANQTLSIFVENQGHICFGTSLSTDFKGIYSDVLLDEAIVNNWSISSVPLNNTDSLSVSSKKRFLQAYSENIPVLYSGEFVLPANLDEPLDTFLNPTGWRKGVAFINGFNLGRYWPVRGPQINLFVPMTVLLPYPAVNKILLFEQEYGAETGTIEFVDYANVNGIPH